MPTHAILSGWVVSIITGRFEVIADSEGRDGRARRRFWFCSTSRMKIKTAGSATISPGGKVKAVQETKAEFRIDFEGGSSTTLCLADPGSSVAVRDKNNCSGIPRVGFRASRSENGRFSLWSGSSLFSGVLIFHLLSVDQLWWLPNVASPNCTRHNLRFERLLPQ
jgi:hypothetical protein